MCIVSETHLEQNALPQRQVSRVAAVGARKRDGLALTNRGVVDGRAQRLAIRHCDAHYGRGSKRRRLQDVVHQGVAGGVVGALPQLPARSRVHRGTDVFERAAQLRVAVGQRVQKAELRRELCLRLKLILVGVAHTGRRGRAAAASPTHLSLQQRRLERRQAGAVDGRRRRRAGRNAAKALARAHALVGDRAHVDAHRAFEALRNLDLVLGRRGDRKARLGVRVPWGRRARHRRVRRRRRRRVQHVERRRVGRRRWAGRRDRVRGDEPPVDERERWVLRATTARVRPSGGIVAEGLVGAPAPTRAAPRRTPLDGRRTRAGRLLRTGEGMR